MLDTECWILDAEYWILDSSIENRESRMADLTTIATQGHFGTVTDRIVAMATQGHFDVLKQDPVLSLTIDITGREGAIIVTKRSSSTATTKRGSDITIV